jgi:hypothetical protein
MKTIKDDDGARVRHGDVIVFSYGIPPIRVYGSVVYEQGDLWVLTPGHTPERERMSRLRKFVGTFYKVDP